MDPESTSPKVVKPRGRNGGRLHGSRNKKTLRQEAKALEEARALVDAAREGKIELAKDVLRRMMVLCEGAAGVHRPNVAEQAAGAPPAGSWDEFGKWVDRTIYTAKELAKYESPTYRAVAVTPMPDNPPGRQGDDAREVRVLGIKDARVLQGTYMRMIAAAGK